MNLHLGQKSKIFYQFAGFIFENRDVRTIWRPNINIRVHNAKYHIKNEHFAHKNDENRIRGSGWPVFKKKMFLAPFISNVAPHQPFNRFKRTLEKKLAG